MLKDIGIIGAGPAGLAALKIVLDSRHWKEGRWKATVFESRNNVGGVWLPAPSTKPGHGPPPTPLYDSLTTNLPHPIMAFSGFSFPPSTPLFPPAKTVEAYLEAYADHFDLRPHIQLNTEVVDAAYNPDTSKWVVQTHISTSSSSDEHEFDLLLVCNGHHTVPRYPRTTGLDAWLASGRASHSMYYRNSSSSPFALDDKHTVLVVGGGPSGQDIVSDISSVVKTVVHSASASLPVPDANTDKVKRRGRLVAFLEAGTVEFEGGVFENGIDYCVLATGYEVFFPFINSSYVQRGVPPPSPPLPRGLWNTSYGMFPLVRYLFPFSLETGQSSTPPPPPTSIAFLGLLVRVVPMPLVEVQAHLALAAFENPDNVDWAREAEEVMRRYSDIKTNNPAEEAIHKAFFRFEPMEQFDYRDALLDFVAELEGADVSSLRVRQWEREMYARKDVLRRTWRALEASGAAEAWVRGVGEGKSGLSGEEEWVELMWRVVRKGEAVGDEEGVEEEAVL